MREYSLTEALHPPQVPLVLVSSVPSENLKVPSVSLKEKEKNLIGGVVRGDS
jgi:hypothetical protein